jgi:hypothetical protein
MMYQGLQNISRRIKMLIRFLRNGGFILAALLVACNAVSTPVATPTLFVEPPTTTPEIFIPLNPSPTPSDSNLPLTCQVTDLQVYVDSNQGYCYAYPNGFTMGESPYFSVPAVMGPQVESSPDVVAATFGVVVTPKDPNLKLATEVDNFFEEFTTASLKTFTRVDLTAGGEAAMMIDNVPVQLSWRLVFVAHNGNLYRLMY